MLAIVCVFLFQTAPPAPAPQEARPAALTAELLTAHPGLFEGRYADVRRDWFDALAADPDSPLAFAALNALGTLHDLCPDEFHPDEFDRIRAAVRDADALRSVAAIQRDGCLRLAFGDAPTEPRSSADLGFVRNWFVLGPFGDLGDEAPLWGPAPEDGPHKRFAPSWPSTFGPDLAWHPVAANATTFYPEDHVYPTSGGTLCAAAWIEADLAEAVLEVWADDEVEVWWNGTLVASELRRGLTHSEPRVFAAVHFAPGPNALVLRLENGSAGWIGARVLECGRRVYAGEVHSIADLAAVPLKMPAYVAAAPYVEPKRVGEGFDAVLDMALVRAEGRPDLALAVPEPADAKVLPAWLRERYLATVYSRHLPQEVHRRTLIEIEERFAELALEVPELELLRAQRLAEEDRPQDALAIAVQLVAAHPYVPAFHQLRRDVLNELDPAGALARAAGREMLAVLEDGRAISSLSFDASHSNDAARALALARRAVQARSGFDTQHVRHVIDLLSNGTREQMREALDWIERWRTADADAYWLDDLEFEILGGLEEFERAEAILRGHCEQRGSDPYTWIALADHLVDRNRGADALPIYQRALALDSGLQAVREAVAALGVEDEAEAFFREFAPDRDAASLAAAGASGASTAMVLDSGLVYVRENGSFRQRAHEIQVALDRTGTEILHERPIIGTLRLARVIDTDGRTFEPVAVDDSLVMPSLDPGDAVEVIYDYDSWTTPGVAPDLGVWRFESFEQPYVLSRYVVFIPDGLPGRMVLHDFDGKHQEIPWRGGMVHVYEVRDRPRLQEEAGRPMDPELLTWLQYGDDVDPKIVGRGFARQLAWASDVAADVEIELRAFLADVEATSSKADLARAIYDALTEHVLDFSGDGDTTDVWTMRRGNPLGLLAALYRLADIRFEWVVPNPPIAPDLDPERLAPFDHWGRYGEPGLRVLAEEGEAGPSWVFIPSGARGMPFGRIPEVLAGARMLVLGRPAAHFEHLPPPSDHPSTLIDLVLHLADDDSASVEGRLEMRDMQGPLLREALSQAEPQQLDVAVRQILAQIVTGIAVEGFEFDGLEQRGNDLVLEFTGTIRGFVKGTSTKPWVKTPWPRINISRAFGRGERIWPLALLASQTEHARIRIVPGEKREFALVPSTNAYAVPGFVFALDLELDEDGSAVIERTMLLRGLRVEADAMAEFLGEVKRIEDLDLAKIDLIPIE